MRGIGIDIAEIDRLEQKQSKKGFIEVAFTSSEISELQEKKNKGEFLASRFAAKEAYMKAVGLGWSEHAEFKEIEIVKNSLGQPSVKLHGKTLTHFEQQGYQSIHLSISHTNTTAVAVVIVE
ncbi:MAG: holo-ACP synthase [Schleiferiaceae bacterium]|jgi:holo-[acyl-carrier protein] synthase|nr:holo-ACP synthase [Schleiferiaceae bacterium]